MRDQPGVAGVVWRGKQDGDWQSPGGQRGLCLAGGPAEVALGQQLRGIRGMVVLEVFARECVAFCCPTPSGPIQNIGGIRGKSSFEVAVSIARMTLSSLTDDWSVRDRT